MDELIQAVVRALGVGASIEDIHDAIIAKGWTEDDAFLAIKAGELLYQTIQEAEEAKAKRTVFRRST
jgi:hypothetical protein